MSNNPTVQFNPSAPAPVSVAGEQHLNHGAVAIEQSRAVSEAQGKLMIAKSFPRDLNSAYATLMDSCKRPGLAGMAIYSFPKGGQTVSGPSIRLAEEIARIYGNIEYGIRELSNANGESEMEAYAWDLQTNVVSSQKFKVRHERKARGKTQALTDSRDVYELTANMGARRLRARLLAVLPPDLVESAVEECHKTIKGSNEAPLADRARKMVAAFAKLGVTQKMIERRLGHPIEEISSEEIADYLGIHNSIKNSQSGREDWFVMTIKVEEKPKASFNPGDTKEDKEKKEPAKKAEPKTEEKEADFDPNKF